MMDKSQFLMDTIGYCFLCLDKSTGNKPTTSSSTEPSSFWEGEEEHRPGKTIPTICSFQNVCQYLKTDLKEVFSDVVSSSSSLSDLEQSQLKGTLCGDCAKLTEAFSEHFGQLQIIQMKLHSCLKSMYGRMTTTTDGNDGQSLEQEFKKEMLRKPYTSFQFGIVERLRRKTLENCSQLFKEAPIVKQEQESMESEPILAEIIEIDPDDTKLFPTPPSSTTTVSETDGDIKYARPLTCGSSSSSSTLSSASSSSSQYKKSSTFAYQCIRCPEKFSSYRAKFDHQLSCSKKSATATNVKSSDCEPRSPVNLGGIVDKPSSSSAAIRKEANKETESFILPDNEVPNPSKSTTKVVTLDKDVRFAYAFSGNQLRYQSIVDPSTGTLKCGVCSKEFSYNQSFLLHYQSAHLHIRYKCAHCGKAFTRQSNYHKHVQMDHGNGERFKCDACGRMYTFETNLESHKLTAHSGGRMRVKCKFCPRTFNTWMNMQRHLKGCPVRKHASVK